MQQRTTALELMDDFSIGGAELTGALGQLRWINRLLGSAWITREGLGRVWRRAGCPAHLLLLDVGAGSGDATGRLLRWSGRRGVAVRILLLDRHSETCAEAARLWQHAPQVQVVCGDVLYLPVTTVDVVLAALFLHHFPDDELPAVVRALQQPARHGVVVNDLHRHPLGWLAIRLLTAVLSRNRMIRHDAPLSVWRGFRPADFAAWQAQGIVWYRWRPMFRYLVLLAGSQHEHTHEHTQEYTQQERQANAAV